MIYKDGASGLYTLAMTDLDSMDVERGAYQEFCHWLVTDIPVIERCVIESAPSIYLKDSSNSQKVEEKNIKIGKTVLPYLPPHPFLTNPKRPHRYFLY